MFKKSWLFDILFTKLIFDCKISNQVLNRVPQPNECQLPKPCSVELIFNLKDALTYGLLIGSYKWSYSLQMRLNFYQLSSGLTLK